MIAVCPAAAPGAAFARRMVDFIDCQAQAIGAGGYQALAAPGSTLSLVLAGFLTLFVAFFGYRLLFGQTPSVRDGVLALVKIGIVLALATSWTAYRTLIYDVALKGPAELAADIGRPAALPGAGGGLAGRLATADRAFELLAIAGSGQPSAPPQTVAGQQQQAPTPPGVVPDMFPGFSAFAIGGARVTFLTAALGALALVRLVAGLLLALGPFFVAFLLFESTRGLFEGWIRVLAGAALGAVGTAIVLGVELALLEPWLVDLLTRRYAGQPIPGAPAELLVATLLFALVLLGILYASARVAFGFALPPAWRGAPAMLGAALAGERARIAGVGRDEGEAPAFGRSRAAAVVDAVAASQRREGGPGPAAALAGPPEGSRIRPQGPARDTAPQAPTPLGHSFRRTTSRVSARAGRRDLSS
jgi:type IV secretion system protein VirB6